MLNEVEQKARQELNRGIFRYANVVVSKEVKKAQMGRVYVIS